MHLVRYQVINDASPAASRTARSQPADACQHADLVTSIHLMTPPTTPPVQSHHFFAVFLPRNSDSGIRLHLF